jgi:hypothetical protein
MNPLDAVAIAVAPGYRARLALAAIHAWTLGYEHPWGTGQARRAALRWKAIGLIQHDRILIGREVL